MRISRVIALCTFSALFVACAIESTSNATPTASQTSAPFTPIVVESTDTPLPAPPTPTSAPSATAAPTEPGKTPSGAELISVEMIEIREWSVHDGERQRWSRFQARASS